MILLKIVSSAMTDSYKFYPVRWPASADKRGRTGSAKSMSDILLSFNLKAPFLIQL